MSDLKNNLNESSWEAAWAAIRAILPNATYATPVSLMTAADKMGLRVDSLNEIGDPNGEEGCFTTLEKLSCRTSQDERVIVITDRSFREGSAPFVFQGTRFRAFADAYKRSTGEHIFSGGDLVVVYSDLKCIFVRHHEGQMALIT